MRCRPSILFARSALVAGALLVALTALGGCGPSASSRRAELLAQGQDKLADDPSAALQVATKGLLEFEGDAQLELLASEACWKLGRRSESLAHAEQGLAGERELPEELEGDLAWSKGRALMGRFLELGAQDDWRAANTVLERAAASGSSRADAAFLLVGLQDLGNHRDDERQLKYARLLVQLDPEGAHAAEVRAALEKKGLTL